MIILVLTVYSVVISVNYFVDPANLYHEGTVTKLVDCLNDGKNVKIPANIDEGVFQEKRIATMTWNPETVIIGSSHVMYMPFDDGSMVYNAGMSGAYLGDYYALIGLLQYYDKMPKKIIIGVDPWTFMRGSLDGKHPSLHRYAEYMKKNIDGSQDTYYGGNYIDDKLKELVSLSYFQSSVEYARKNRLRKAEEHVEAVSDDLIGDDAKILVDGRRVPSVKNFLTQQEIDEEILKLLNKGTMYQMGTGFKDVQHDNIADFEKLLQYLQANGVEVSIYLPVWHPKIYSFFCESEAFSGVKRIEDTIRKIGYGYHIPVHGGYDPRDCGITENDFMDYLHLKPEKMKENYELILDSK